FGLTALLERNGPFDFARSLRLREEGAGQNPSGAGTHQNSILVPNCTERGWLHCRETRPNWPELQFWFGSQKTTRFVKLPPCASNRHRMCSPNFVTLKMLTSSTMLGNPRTWGSRGAALPNASGPGSV